MFDNDKNGKVTLESKNYINYLGVLVDKNLTWKYHIDAITAKNRSVKLLNQFKTFKNSALYNSSYTVIYLPNINPSSPKLCSCCQGSGIQDFPQ